ncbi:MAG: hypothetical protein WCH86_02030, partial [Kiritimatiellales bacterium]
SCPVFIPHLILSGEYVSNPHITRKKHATVGLEPGSENTVIQILESQETCLPDFDKSAPFSE